MPRRWLEFIHDHWCRALGALLLGNLFVSAYITVAAANLRDGMIQNQSAIRELQKQQEHTSQILQALIEREKN